MERYRADRGRGGGNVTVLAIKQPPAVVDEMGEASFPASDPPAVWTWEVKPAPVSGTKTPAMPGRADGTVEPGQDTQSHD